MNKRGKIDYEEPYADACRILRGTAGYRICNSERIPESVTAMAERQDGRRILTIYDKRDRMIFGLIIDSAIERYDDIPSISRPLGEDPRQYIGLFNEIMDKGGKAKLKCSSDDEKYVPTIRTKTFLCPKFEPYYIGWCKLED